MANHLYLTMHKIIHKAGRVRKCAGNIANNSATGFSLVELMVALLFTLLLMAGLGTVFKTSLSTFYISGENLSNARRNRMSIDVLSDDINLACMYLTDIAMPPQTLANLPPFYIIPNVAIASPGADGPTATDELYFYLDEPLPFEGVLVSTTGALTAADAVASGTDLSTTFNSYNINCGHYNYAKLVEQGQVAIIKDFWEAVYIGNKPSPASGSAMITIEAQEAPNVGITGAGSTGLPTKASHIPGTSVMFVRPAQMIRYRIMMLHLDPTEDPDATGIPCLVREQGAYSWAGGGFVPDPDMRPQIITENVSGFKVYLSADGGLNWAGMGFTATGPVETVWNGTNGLRSEIDRQLSPTGENAGRPGYQTTRGDEHWFRNIPTLVRVDLTTRTATKRAEFDQTNPDYDPSAPKLAHKEITQSLVFVPRHSGLPMH